MEPLKAINYLLLLGKEKEEKTANTNVVSNGPRSNKLEAGDQVGRARTPITRVLGSLSPVELLTKEHFEDYLFYPSS